MKTIVKAAIEVRKNAHAPYSNYTVGAAVETDDGTIVTGCNVESSSYGLTICAERAAICSAVAKGYRNFKRLAISSKGSGGPCGACRQFIWDLCGDIPVIIIGEDGSTEELQSSKLLPRAFDDRSLIKSNSG